MRRSFLAAVAAFAAFAFAAVDPLTGTLGTELSITLETPVASKPKALLVHTETGRNYPLKVTSFDGNSVEAVVGRVVAGTYDLDVRSGRGATATTEIQEDAFTVSGPSAAMVTPQAADPNESVTIDGAYFGTARPTVTVGTKKAKVTSFTDSLVTFLVPKTLANGTYDVTLKNGVGTTTLAQALTVENSPVGLPRVKGKAGFFGTAAGSKISAAGVKCSFLFRPLFDTAQISVATTSGSLRSPTVHQLTFSFPIDLDDIQLPYTTAVSLATYLRGGLGQPSTAWSGTGTTLTITAYDGSKIQGSVSGSIPPGNGSTPAQVSGNFVATVVRE